MSEDLNPIGALSKYYSGHPGLQALLKLIPGWASADALLQARALELRIDRITTFSDELAKGNVELTDDVIKDNDFLHCFFKTTHAVMNTRRKEKIRMFARLLKSSLTGTFSDADEYEEYLGILDELSFRELRILSILEKYQFPQASGENGLQRATRFWDSFISEIAQHGIPKDEINAFLTRLNRSGCYAAFGSDYAGADNIKGELTPMYFKLKSAIQDINDKYTGEEFARKLSNKGVSL